MVPNDKKYLLPKTVLEKNLSKEKESETVADETTKKREEDNKN